MGFLIPPSILNREPDDYIKYGHARYQSRNKVWRNLRVATFQAWGKEYPEKKVTGGCTRNNSNTSCSTILQCPQGYVAVSGRAACNLEYSHKTLKLGGWDQMVVVRSSDDTDAGFCRLGRTVRQSGKGPIEMNLARTVAASCEAYDRHGGDCEIKAEVMCFPDSQM